MKFTILLALVAGVTALREAPEGVPERLAERFQNQREAFKESIKKYDADNDGRINA